MPPLEPSKNPNENISPPSPMPFPNPNTGSVRDIGIVRPPSVDQAAKLNEAVIHAREQEKKDQIKPLRTYQSDVADAIKRDNVSVIKMVVAEKKRQEDRGFTPEAISTESKKSIVFSVLSIILVLAGLAIIGYFLFTHISNQTAVTINIPKNIVYAEKNSQLILAQSEAATLVSEIGKIKQNDRPKGTLENVIVTEQGADITGSRLITILNSRIPAPIFRSIQDPYMLGIYQPQFTDSSEVFLILKSDSYEIAYSGMLDWEQTLQKDMTPLFSILQAPPPMPPTIVSISTTTASSSIATTSSNTVNTSTSTLASPAIVPLVPTVPTRPFTDRLILNRDTRVITDLKGKVVFLYSFLDPNTIVFTESEEAFKEIVSRFIQNGQEK